MKNTERQVTMQTSNQESGNVLFLILIAVALFAALSYAVTQSTRSGAGDTSGETNLISSAQLTQYPAGVRTALVRMIIGGISIEDLLFNDPSDFGAGGAIDTDKKKASAVFYPTGGNATFQLAPKETVTAGNGAWVYNVEAQIQNIGLTDASTPDANDLIAWLPDVSPGICRRINAEIGIGSTVPEVSGLATAVYTTNMDTDYDFPDNGGPIIAGDDDRLIGQPFACFLDADNDRYVYYHVLIER